MFFLPFPDSGFSLFMFQMAESRNIYAEEKESEVRLLERSVEELECTINVLENKVSCPIFFSLFIFVSCSMQFTVSELKIRRNNHHMM